MLKIRRPLGRLIFNIGITIPCKTVFLIETAPWTGGFWHVHCTTLHELGRLHPRKSLHVATSWDTDVWWHRSESTLAQVMACCLTVPSHYLSHCWLIICEIWLHSSERNFTRNVQDDYHLWESQNYKFKITAMPSRTNEWNSQRQLIPCPKGCPMWCLLIIF